MKFSIFLLGLFAFSLSLTAQLPTELQTPEIVSVNRMPMRASAFAFESKELAVKRTKESSKYFLSLNGDWRFNWVQNPNERPKNFFKTDFDDSKWGIERLWVTYLCKSAV